MYLSNTRILFHSNILSFKLLTSTKTERHLKPHLNVLMEIREKYTFEMLIYVNNFPVRSVQIMTCNHNNNNETLRNL